ncbi:galactose mutarotase [Kibdelosporangium lantanae]
MTRSTTTAPVIGRELYGRIGGTDIHRHVLAWPGGITVRVLDYGGVVQSLDAPDRDGTTANVVLGFPTLDGYVANTRPDAPRAFLGALIGRYANRIAHGRFTLDGVTYHVPCNNGDNSLHGGPSGFDSRVWTSTGLADGVRLTLVSQDGDQGFPGTVTTEVTYRLEAYNRLAITYQATTDAPTVVNLTNHAYWNLAGEGNGTVYGHSLVLNAGRVCPTDDTLIPVGEPVPVEGTPFDFRRPTEIGARLTDPDPQLRIGGGYDHNWVLDRTNPTHLSFAAQVHEPESGRLLTMWTTEPGVQFYSGNFLSTDLRGTSGRSYHRGAGFALEAQHFPDAPNRPDFPSTVLRPGEVYHQKTVFELTTTSTMGD